MWNQSSGKSQEEGEADRVNIAEYRNFRWQCLGKIDLNESNYRGRE
jgi:hypothetical protein